MSFRVSFLYYGGEKQRDLREGVWESNINLLIKYSQEVLVNGVGFLPSLLISSRTRVTWIFVTTKSDVYCNQVELHSIVVGSPMGSPPSRLKRVFLH